MINLKTLTTIIILAFSSVMPAMVFAQPSEVSADDWVYVNGNSWG